MILIGTGSEVALCVEAYETLGQRRHAARVVSMPSWELFERQDQAYRDSVLPPDDRGARLGRGGLGRSAGIAMSARTAPRLACTRFGASAPIKDLMTKFGFTPEKVVAAAKDQIAEHRRA